MKKAMCIVLALACAVCLAGCGSRAATEKIEARDTGSTSFVSDSWEISTTQANEQTESREDEEQAEKETDISENDADTPNDFENVEIGSDITQPNGDSERSAPGQAPSEPYDAALPSSSTAPEQTAASTTQPEKQSADKKAPACNTPAQLPDVPPDQTVEIITREQFCEPSASTVLDNTPPEQPMAPAPVEPVQIVEAQTPVAQPAAPSPNPAPTMDIDSMISAAHAYAYSKNLGVNPSLAIGRAGFDNPINTNILSPEMVLSDLYLYIDDIAKLLGETDLDHPNVYNITVQDGRIYVLYG